jgi:hypothetical protein
MRSLLLVALLILPLAAAHVTEAPHNETDAQVCGPSEPGAEGGWRFAVVLIAGIGVIALVVHAEVPWKPVLLVLATVLLIGGMWMLWVDLEINRDTVHFGEPGSTHEHADFQVMINNQIVDLTDERYLSVKGNLHSDYVHMHHIDNVVHSHATNVTLGVFLQEH